MTASLAALEDQFLYDVVTEPLDHANEPVGAFANQPQHSSPPMTSVVKP